MSNSIGAGKVVVDILAFWALLIVMGLPMTLACLPHARRHLTLPVAPLAAIAGLSSLSHLTFFAVLQPYRPLATYGIFFLSSTILFATHRPRSWTLHGRIIMRDALRGWPFLVIPLLFVVGFGTLFWSNGLLLFSAAEDELGYIDVARHIIGHLNTHDALDVPWPRPDHLLTDTTANSLSYIPSARLGAFVLLADMSTLFKLPLELTFPLIAGVNFAIGIATLGIVRLHLRNKGYAILSAQAGLAVSGVLLMLLFQGSLSSTVAIGFRIGGLAIVLWAVSLKRGWRPLLLAIVLTSGWLPVYVESFGIGLIIPLLVAVIVAEWIEWRSGIQKSHRLLIRSFILLVSVFCIHPDLVVSTFLQYRDQANSLDFVTLVHDPNSALSSTKIFLDNVLLPIIGAYSLYDRSTANLLLGRAVFPYMFDAMLVLSLLSSIGFATRLKSIPVASAWAVLTVALTSLSIVAGLGNSSVASTRGAQWFMPLGILGLSLFAFGKVRRKRPPLSIYNALLSTTAMLTWITFFVSNLNSVVRTALHVNAHTRETELTIRYFDSSRPPWTVLRAAVANPDNAPVLLSGFLDTPRSHTIVEGLRETPVIVGQTIMSYWIGIDPMQKEYARFIEHGIAYWDRAGNILAKLSEAPVTKKRWPDTYARMLGETSRAIVPNGGSYPIEWGRRGTLLGTRSVRFANLCDVIDRTGPALELASGQVAAGEDANGPYWTAEGPFTVRSASANVNHSTLSIAYDGPPPEVKINEVTLSFSVAAQPASANMIWTTTTDLSKNDEVRIVVRRETKLRSIDLYH